MFWKKKKPKLEKKTLNIRKAEYTIMLIDGTWYTFELADSSSSGGYLTTVYEKIENLLRFHLEGNSVKVSETIIVPREQVKSLEITKLPYETDQILEYFFS